MARSLDRDLLASVLTRLEHDLRADDPGHGGVLFGVAETDAQGVTLATRHIDVADPVEALIGFSAPPEWSAFGLVTRGRSRPMIDDGHRPRADMATPPAPVRLAMVVDRSGLGVSGLRTLDGPFIVRHDGGELIGHIPDACRRVLGLGTPPPDDPVEEFFDLLWLDHVLAEAAGRPGQLTWAEAVELHFGAGLVTDMAPTGDDIGALSADEALMVGHALTSELTSWRFVREQAARMDERTELFDPQAAAWMDDGMFSREMLGGFPPVGLMLEALEQVAPPPVLGAMVRTLAGWQLV
ncbi:MAG: hypothetical protein ACXV95_04420 [Acidimicrobiales bacterium]